MIGSVKKAINGTVTFLASLAAVVTFLLQYPDLLSKLSPTADTPVTQSPPASNPSAATDKPIGELKGPAPKASGGSQSDQAAAQTNSSDTINGQSAAPPLKGLPAKANAQAGKTLTVMENSRFVVCGLEGAHVVAWRSADRKLMPKYSIYIPRTVPGSSLPKTLEIIAPEGNSMQVTDSCKVQIIGASKTGLTRISFVEMRE